MCRAKKLGRWAGMGTALWMSQMLAVQGGSAVTVWEMPAHADAGALARDVVQKAGWRKAGGPLSKAGDVCVESDRLLLSIRHQAAAVECWVPLGGAVLPVARLSPAGPAANGGGMGQGLQAIRVLEAGPEQVRMEAQFTGASVSFVVKPGKPFVEVRPGEGAGKIRVELRGRYALLPDVFAGDVLLRAQDVPAARVRFPSEHLLALLTEGGEAVVTCAWSSREQGVTLCADGDGNGRALTAAEIDFGREPGMGVWVAALAGPAIWAEKPIADLNPVKDVAMDWKVPFRALWRADYRRTDGLIDSWKCPIRVAEDKYEGFDFSPKKARSIWHSARGTFAYPACIVGETCWLRKSRFEPRPELQYDGDQPVVVYPDRAIPGSPGGTYGVMDVLREAFEGTPQASLHERLRVVRPESDKWPATCSVTQEYEQVFDAGEEKVKKDHLLGRLDAMNNFVLNIRSRMNEYLTWAGEMRVWLAQTKAGQPALAPLVDEAGACLAQFDKVYADRKLDERNPAAAAVLIEEVRALIDSNEAREVKSEKAQLLGRETRTIGGNQDSAIGEFRMFTKQMRQRAGYRMAEARDDLAFEFQRKIRERTLEVLHCALGHECASLD